MKQTKTYAILFGLCLVLSACKPQNYEYDKKYTDIGTFLSAYPVDNKVTAIKTTKGTCFVKSVPSPVGKVGKVGDPVTFRDLTVLVGPKFVYKPAVCIRGVAYPVVTPE